MVSFFAARGRSYIGHTHLWARLPAATGAPLPSRRSDFSRTCLAKASDFRRTYDIGDAQKAIAAKSTEIWQDLPFPCSSVSFRG